VKMRASQINGCAYCLDMHSHDARRHGETERRLYLLNAWRDSPIYSDRERAALAWTERLTLVASQAAPEVDYEALTRHFSPVDIVNLSTAIGMINLWNRLMIGIRGQYAPSAPAAA
jgi:AhpD family alkylhydroperoxidase